MVAAHPHIDPTGPAWATPVYDAVGNMTIVPRPSDPANYYTCKYDAWHRLVETVWGILADGEYEYDGLNRRTIESPKLLMRLHRHFFWNASWQNLEVRTTYTADAQPESLSVLHQYVWSARYIDAPVLRDKPGSGERIYYLCDANFNVTTLVDTNGDAVEHYQYDPYGKVTILNGGTPDSDGAEWTADPNNSSDVSNEYFFAGRKRDHKTFFYNNRNRYYHAELGRFISRDPIGYKGKDFNLYRYVHNSPTNATDPTGKAWWNPYCVEPLNAFVAHSCCFSCRWSSGVGDSANEAATLGQAFADSVNSDHTSGVNIALRHCFTSAYLAVKEGCKCAGCIGDARETYQTWCQGQSNQNRNIGDYNNWRGRQCAGCTGDSARGGQATGDAASIKKCCLKKLDDGDLFVPVGGGD